ncbi:Thioredoxin-like protein [Cytospora mali]|uniref:Thioredoxin-like protein n=1 Tax=Cytospora mali TaxID=578113 RepID=A0A194WE52_CYTMA|nr:Thioredoxin-like protein [Valsa mali]
MAVHIGSSSEWRDTLQSTIVVADFYADWCGPCKMIAPTFESLATKYTKPKRITFAKVNVDNQRDVASQYGVRAMPTFMIFKNGSAIETIQGANPQALTAAVEKAVKLAGPTTGAGFSAPGRTLGAGGQPRQSLQRPLKWDLNNFLNAIINFIGLYFVSLFSLDPYKAAENSKYNIHNPVAPAAIPRGSATGAGAGVKKPAPKATFRTLADLGGD